MLHIGSKRVPTIPTKTERKGREQKRIWQRKTVALSQLPLPVDCLNHKMLMTGVSVTWNDMTLHRMHPTVNTDVLPPPGGEQMAALTDEEPFCFDTGVMSHISPVRADFA